MQEKRVTDIRAINLAVRDLAASVDFYLKAWGLQESARDKNVVYLRGTGAEHHVLALHQAPQIALLGASFAAPDKSTVDALHEKAVAFGADMLDTPHAFSPVAGGGYGFRFRTPDGITYAITCDVARHGKIFEDHLRPNKFSHIVLRSADFPDLERFFCDLLGFKVSDKTDGIDFLRCSSDHHSVALGRLPGRGLHHMAFEVPNFDGLMSASGRMKAHGYPMEWGVGRHAGPGNNIFSFFVDPNGFAVEYTTEMEQVDEKTYPHRTAEDWRKVPLRPCAWGLATQRSERLLLARTGKLVDELNQSCIDIISRKIAS